MQGPAVQLFVTCLVDAFAPHVGRSAVAALESAGYEVGFALDQTCCGQPALNVGFQDLAREMAGHTLDVLDRTDGPIVVPSGSCAEMLIHHYPQLFAGTERDDQANRIAGRTRELTQFLAESDGPIRAACGGCRIAFHYSCHGLRGLGLDAAADELLIELDRVELEDDRVCCGFGGLFSVEMPVLSAAMMDEKLDKIESSGASVLVGGDISCLMHLEGGLRRRGSKTEVKHIAELLGSHDDA